MGTDLRVSYWNSNPKQNAHAGHDTFYLSLSHSLEVIADDLESCRNQALALRIEHYWDDYIL